MILAIHPIYSINAARTEMCSSPNNPSLLKAAGVKKVQHAAINNKGTGELVAEPMPMDVLCGKSRKCISHEGTRLFRIVIEQYRVRYQQAKSKQDRMDITKEIVASIGRNGARFLKYNSAMQCWENIGTLAARDKVSHALRCANQKSKNSRKFVAAASAAGPSPCHSVASDASSVASATEESTTSVSSLNATIPETLETVIGDQQTILSWFSDSKAASDPELPVAKSLMDFFEADAVSFTSSSAVAIPSNSSLSSSNADASSRLTEANASAPFPSLMQESHSDNLPLARLHRTQRTPSPPDQDQKEDHKNINVVHL